MSRASFQAVQFGNTWFDAGQFMECDFREALLQPTTPLPPQSMIGAVFERCDFRDADFTGSDLSGATFRACKFGGAHGRPAATKGVQVVEADFSAAGDGGDTGGVVDLLAQFGHYDPDKGLHSQV
ncbi:MAG: pentapeptide repeat-containing protein [Pyrinomonadaceae bacterium]